MKFKLRNDLKLLYYLHADCHKEYFPKFPGGYLDQQKPEEGQMEQWPKHCNNKNKDEDISSIVKTGLSSVGW